MTSALMHCRDHAAKIDVRNFDTFVSLNMHDYDMNEMSLFVANLDAAETLAREILAQCQTIRASESMDAEQPTPDVVASA